ncbi:glycerophosphodiester phosphodiesterase family protein [Trueperella pyogenes]
MKKIVYCVTAVAFLLAFGLVQALNVSAVVGQSACPSWETQYQQLRTPPAGNKVITARHRGAFDGFLPENSMGAFVKAFQNCASAVETDVRKTADGQLVLFHDINIGKMLEPTYDPETNTGPNQRLSEVTYAELSRKHLLRPNRQETHYVVPTVNELINYVIDNDVNSLIHLEIKDPTAILEVARLLRDHHQVNPNAHILKRVVIKFNMGEYPTPAQWKAALEKEGIVADYTLMPVIAPVTAQRINVGSEIPNPEELELTTNASRAVAHWGKAPMELAPIIEVVVKDSSEFLYTEPRTHSSFGNYAAPTKLSLDNVKKGTVAEFVALTHFYRKNLGAFVPVPDYGLFTKGPRAGFTVPNTFGDHTPIAVTDAFYNNDSSCCYAVEDRRYSTEIASEAHDWRINLDWQHSIGANILTADDTDSIEMYSQQHGYLNSVARPNPQPASKEMNSVLKLLAEGHSVPDSALVKIKGWNGASASTWGGQVCLWSDPGYYLWTIACSLERGGYSPVLEIHTVGKGKMLIRDPQSLQCLTADPDVSEVISWKDNCNHENAHWTRTPAHRFLDSSGREINFQWDDRYSYGYPFAYNFLSRGDTSTWSQWLLEPFDVDSNDPSK